MPIPDRKTRTYPALALTTLLGLAVFFWGLHYKLSLYHSPVQAAHTSAAAKLLSQKERPDTGVKGIYLRGAKTGRRTRYTLTLLSNQWAKGSTVPLPLIEVSKQVIPSPDTQFPSSAGTFSALKPRGPPTKA